MNFKDSFDQMVTEIERLIEYDDNEGYLKADIIFGKIAGQVGIPGRDLSVIFSYISGGKTLNRYIKDRKMMATYNLMIKDEDYNVQSYLECSGYELESSFSKAFSEKFGVPPTTAHKQKDETKIEAPLTIDKIINESDIPDNNDIKPSKVFGLPKKLVDRYNDICEYQAIFGLEDKFVELAVYLNEEKGVDLKDAFSSVENLVMDYEEMSEKQTLDDMLSYINSNIPVVYIKHLYPDVYLPELNDWYDLMKSDGGNALIEKPEFVRAYIDNDSDGLSYSELKEIYNKYLENNAGTHDFWEYLEGIQLYGSIESYNEFMDNMKSGQYLSNEESAELDDKIFWENYDEEHLKDM